MTSGHRFLNGFVYDDVAVIVDGEVIHDLGRFGDVWTHHTMIASARGPEVVQSVDTYRPLPIVSFMLDSTVSGRSPWSYHLTNLALHLGCVLLVFALALRWLDPGSRRGASETPSPRGAGPVGPALYGAALFAVHPWLVEAHVWINGRSDPLCLLFGLLAMLALLEAEAGRSWLRFVSFPLLLLGLLSKETLIMVFPAILVMPAARGNRRSVLRRLGPLTAAATSYIALRMAVLGGARTHRDGAMLVEALRRLPVLLLDSMRQIVAPSVPYLRSLRDEYGEPTTLEMTLGVVAVLVLIGVALRYRRQARTSSWAIVWVLPPMVPIAVITTVLWPGFGRYLYVPMAGVAWLVAELSAEVARRLPRPRLGAALATLHVGVLGVLCFGFTSDFRDDERLYQAAADARPDVAMGHGWLGMTRLRRGDAAGAIEPLSRAVGLDPGAHRYLIKLGEAFLAMGDRPQAMRVAELGLERFAHRPEAAAYHLLAVNAMPRRDPTEAVSHLLGCLAARPGRGDCQAALRALIAADTPDAAANRRALDEALARSPPSVRREVASLRR